MVIRDMWQQHRKSILYGAACVLVIFVVAFLVWGRSKDPKYLTATVRLGDITAIVQATGTINPLTTVPVGSFVSGTVQYIFADFNTRVHEGQVLAQLDPSIYEAQVIQARGNLENARASEKNLEAMIEVDQANLAKAQANLNYAQVNQRRISNLFKEGVLSQDQSDLTQSTLGQSQADVRAAQAAIEQARAQLSQAKAQIMAMEGALRQTETNLRYTTILSPIDGTVVARNITVGQSVAASLQAPNVFTIAQDLKRMQVYAKTDESDTGSVKVGTDVAFQVDAFPGEVFHGRVSAIRLNAYTVQNVVTYDTVIDFDNPQEKLLPGETAYVTIPTGQAVNALEFPNTALTYTPDLPRPELLELYNQYNIPREAYTSHLGGWQLVWKFGADKKPAPVAVKAGVTDYSNTQVLEGNLKEGDLLITGLLSASGNSAQGPLQQNGPRFGGPRR
jgi:HlyD family secretion protein